LKTLTKKEIDYLVIGASILGTGGGGDPKAGLHILSNDIEKGRRFDILSWSEVPDNALIVCPYSCGSIAPSSKRIKPKSFEDSLCVAFQTLEKKLGRKAFATVATELGGLNTAASLHVAAVMNLPALDGDYLGRAAPELIQSSANIFGVSVFPAAVASEDGTVMIIEKCCDLNRYEKIVRHLSVLAGSPVAVVDTPVDGIAAKRTVVRNTLSKCIKVGKTVRDANFAGKDPIHALIECLNGTLLFKGEVQRYDWENREGFLYGEVTYDGMNDYIGHELRIWIKNENIIAWKDGQMVATTPDLICVVNEKGYAITNTELKKGMTAAVIGVKAPDVWFTSKGMEIFGPKHFGFDCSYAPIKAT